MKSKGTRANNESSCVKNRDCSKNIWINSQFLALKLLCSFLALLHPLYISTKEYSTFIHSFTEHLRKNHFSFEPIPWFGIDFKKKSSLLTSWIIQLVRMECVIHVSCNFKKMSTKRKMINQTNCDCNRHRKLFLKSIWFMLD